MSEREDKQCAKGLSRAVQNLGQQARQQAGSHSASRLVCLQPNVVLQPLIVSAEELVHLQGTSLPDFILALAPSTHRQPSDRHAEVCGLAMSKCAQQ